MEKKFSFPSYHNSSVNSIKINYCKKFLKNKNKYE